jgi:hypothetical protein
LNIHNVQKQFDLVATRALGSQSKQGLARLRINQNPKNEERCEGMNPHTCKGTSTLGIWSPDGFSNLITKGQNLMD